MREPTESIHLDGDDDGGDAGDIDDEDLAPPPLGDSLARGTGLPPEDRTKVATPAARNRTPLPPEPDAQRSSDRARQRPRRSSAPQRRGGDSPDANLGAVLGSYRIVDVLGKGGMGFVYRAEHVKLGREVALKLLRADYARRRDAVARFFQEARTVNRIRHRNIVDVTDFVELDDGTTFIIMELLRGESLAKWAKQHADLARALAILIQICDGLAAAHTVGVIHRDLKPDNVIVVPTSDGAELVKLLDFGVAKLVNRDDEDVGLETAAGSVIGTPAYMSPEQAGGMPVDARSDIYSVGAIMYELFCGQPMFRGRSFGEYVRKHLSELPPRPKATVGGAGMDERLEAAILRAIDKDPSRRFGSIAELRDTLLHLLGAIETRPPGREIYTGDLIPSLAHHASSPPLMAPMMTPLPPPLVPIAAPIAPTIGMHVDPNVANITGISSLSQLPMPPQPSQRLPSQIMPRTTPWWVWFAGGALAVGLGIGGAVWYATREDPPAPAPVRPTITALPDPPREPAPRVVQIQFTSTPAGGVYAVGSATELCRTPCTLDVDLRDGGALDHRDYVIKAAGFVDAPVKAVLTGDHVAVPAVALAPAPRPVVIKDSTEDDAGRHGRKDKDTHKKDDKTDVRDLTGDDDKAIKPADPTPPDKDKDTHKIDRTDTLDPFAPPKDPK